MTIPPKSQLGSAYTIVETYLAREYGEQALAHAHVKTITHAAFRYLKEHGTLSPKEWKRGHTPNNDQQELLLSAVRAILVSAKTPWKPGVTLDSRIKTVFFEAMRGRASTHELLQDRMLLHAIICKKNPQLLQEARQLVSTIFEDMYQQLSTNPHSDSERFHMEMIIGDLLSLLPFLSPGQNEEIKVPVYSDGIWQLAPYTVQHIHLTPKWMGSQIVAIGLAAKGPTPPLLLFKGTTYPADKGFSLSLLTDINPGASVGAYAFCIGKQQIRDWLETNTKQKPAIVYGKSLGGAQAWRTALNFPQAVQKVMAYAAPGFSSYDLQKLEEIMNSSSHPPEINFFCQKGDPTSYLDLEAKRGVNYFEVIGEQKYSGVPAHAHMYSTHEQSLIIHMDEHKKDQRCKRLCLTVSRLILSILIFPLLILAHAAQTAARRTIRLIGRQIIKK